MKRFYTFMMAAFAAVSVMAQSVPGPYLDPQGEESIYKVEREGFFVVWGEIAPDASTAASTVVYGENNEVYFKLVPKSGHPGYVKGVKQDGKILVELPQAVGTVIDDWTEEETDLYVDLMSYVEIDGYQWYVNSGETSVVEFAVAEDGSFSLNLKTEEDGYFPAQIIGVLSDLDPDGMGWMGYGDWTMTYAENKEVPLALPEGLTSETWRMFYEYEGRNVEVAIDGNDIYLGNLTDELPESFVKGTIDGDKVTFPLTYLGYSEWAGNFVYFVPCYWEEFYYEKYDEMLEDYIIHDEWVFDYDAEEKKLTNIDDFAALMVGTSNKVGDMAGGYTEMFFEPEIRYLDPARANDPLADPEFLNAYYDEWYDCDMVEFFLPSMNQGGYPLDTERLSYIFYVNGKPLTFDTETYKGLDEDMTEIPFDFSDFKNQDIWSYGQEHQLCLYIENYRTVGLKMLYEKEDGTVIESAYVEADIEELSGGSITVGVQAAEAGNAKRVEYFDLQGRAVSSPKSGMYIMVKHNADGSRTTRKIMR